MGGRDGESFVSAVGVRFSSLEWKSTTGELGLTRAAIGGAPRVSNGSLCCSLDSEVVSPLYPSLFV